MDTPTLAILFIIGIISFILIITIVVVLVMISRKETPPNNPTFYVEPELEPKPTVIQPAPESIVEQPQPVVFEKLEPLHTLFSDPSDDDENQHHVLLSDDSDIPETNKSTIKLGAVDEVINIDRGVAGVAKYGKHTIYLTGSKTVLINGGDFDRDVEISHRCVEVFTFSGQLNFLTDEGKIYMLDSNDFKNNHWSLTPAHWSLIASIKYISVTFDQKYLWVSGSQGSGLYTAGDLTPTLTQSTERFIRRTYGKSMYDYIEFVDGNGIIHPSQELYPNIEQCAVLNYYGELIIPQYTEKLFKLGWNIASFA